MRVSRIAHERRSDPILAGRPAGNRDAGTVEAVVNADPARGQSLSLRLGIERVPSNRAALILLVDQPTMPPESIAAVLARADGARWSWRWPTIGMGHQR